MLISRSEWTPIIENIIEPFFSQQKGLYSLFKDEGNHKSHKNEFDIKEIYFTYKGSLIEYLDPDESLQTGDIISVVARGTQDVAPELAASSATCP